MAVLLGPQPLPQVVLSRDIGTNAIREARTAGLVRVSHGAFVAPLPDAEGWAADEHLARARIRAAAHRLRGTPVFSHESAALVHGLWLLRVPAQVHVTQRGTPSRQSPGLRRHTGELSSRDVVEVGGTRVTSVERTIADCAKTLHPRDALVVADSGMRLLVGPFRDRRRTLETETLRRVLAQAVEEGARTGRRQARAVVAHADPLAESPYETVIRWLAVSRGLPAPLLQVRFVLRGRTYYPDMCWALEIAVDGTVVRVRILGEYDGEGKYLGPRSAARGARVVLAEKRREDDLRSLPDTVVLRFDRGDAARPDATFRRICAHLPPAYVAGLRPVPELLGLSATQRTLTAPPVPGGPRSSARPSPSSPP